MNEPLFRRRTLVALIGASAISLFAGIILAIVRGGGPPDGEARADAYSVGATGHRALVELLRRLGREVIVDEGSFAGRVGTPAVLVVAEPSVEALQGRVANVAAGATRVLLVLSKWEGEPDVRDRTMLASAREVPPWIAAAPLGSAGVGGELVRPGSVGPWVSQLKVVPTIANPQLLVTSDLRPIISTGGSILVGERTGRAGKLLVLTDPDVISNHGLGRGDNAAVAAALFDELGAGTIVFDETVHGHTRPPSVFRALLRPPLLFATLQALVAALMLAWAAAGRFGPPAPLRPVLGAGSRPLIESTAALLRLGGHSGEALQMYLRATLHDVAAALHAPDGLAPDALASWLDRVGRARKVPQSAAGLEAEVRDAPGEGARGLLKVARRIHDFRTGMLDGSD